MSSVNRRPRSDLRFLLKLSGECFASGELLERTARQLARAAKLKVTLAVVIGGGNILRGRDVQDTDRVRADQSGMLATVLNGNRLQAALESSVPVRHMCALEIHGFVERYSVPAARQALAQGSLLVLSGGTGNPFFSTDSAAALRAAELGAAALLKATNVPGVYSADPKKHPGARLYRRLSYEQALSERLAVMDLTAFALCMERRIPIRVFDLRRPNAIVDIVRGKQIGSYIC